MSKNNLLDEKELEKVSGGFSFLGTHDDWAEEKSMHLPDSHGQHVGKKCSKELNWL